MKRLIVGVIAALVVGAAGPVRLPAQERGAIALGELIRGLGVTTRVLVVGAHPDDEDSRLIAYLARGRGVETAYLSLTRGDGGQNLIGHELGEALGAIRGEELLAARRVDGARQYFTRAYDFGFSKSAEETFRHWPHDSLLADVVTVVRAFRPHVIVGVFTGTAQDGHGQHQAAGILAGEAYALAADTVRFPPARFGPPWSVLKLYRSANFRGTPTLTYDAGEYSPLHGRTYAEIAAESRSQHKSQGFGSLQRRGVVRGAVRREASRVAAPEDATRERSLFDGIDTGWTRLRAQVADAPARAALDSVAAAVEEARRRAGLFDPAPVVEPLLRLQRLLRRACGGAASPTACDAAAGARLSPDAEASLRVGLQRVNDALALALGLSLEATAARAVLAVGDTATVTVTVYNRGTRPVDVAAVEPVGTFAALPTVRVAPATLAPDSAATAAVTATGRAPTTPAWLAGGRRGDLFAAPVPREALDRVPQTTHLVATLRVGDAGLVRLETPVVHRIADPVRGDVSGPLAVVPAITLTLGQATEFAPAHEALERTVRVQLRSAARATREVRVALALPAGLAADTAVRTVSLPPGAERAVAFRVRGRLAPGRHRIAVTGESAGERVGVGYVAVAYEHIRPQWIEREAALALEAVDVRLPRRLDVAYIPGVGDNVAPALQQLGVPVTLLDPADVPRTDLARFSAIIVGPRAYESRPELAAHNARLLEYVRMGGRMVVQYGQYEMTRSGMMPYPITIARPHDRVTDEGAAVRVLDPDSPLLTVPNRITARDFEGWVQERALYMPRTADPRFVPLLSMHDPGEPPNTGAVLVAPYGRGTYVYTTLSFFRQLPAGVPGAARLFVNLLGADARALTRDSADRSTTTSP